MIQIQQLKLQIPHTKEQLLDKAAKLLRVGKQEILSFEILRRSMDARKKPLLFYVYTVQMEVKKEAALKKRIKNKNITFLKKEKPYKIVPTGKKEPEVPPVVIGTGPAGLFCGYELALLGYRPILLERGADVDTRKKAVEAFWETGDLDPNSNVQFGEGGAGTFSDGKLNTLVNDSFGRNKEVLRLFVKFGAPEQILYDHKPHVGTDILADVVKRIRQEILRLGGEVHFFRQVTDFRFQREDVGTEVLSHVQVLNTKTGAKEWMRAQIAVLAIGHSARDTFYLLRERSFEMTAKSFAVGVRVEHPQEFINESQYGAGYDKSLPAAPYKLAVKLANGRGVYTFCMCPGGYVVNASSEKGRLAVNGMSYSRRDGANANSAVIVTVSPEDFGSEDVLAGIKFQRMLEERAFAAGKGRIPVQRFEDYCQDRATTQGGEILPQMKGGYTWSNVRSIFPEGLAKDLEDGILGFDAKIRGYANPDALVSGVESRTSSPIRIVRDETLQSSRRGIYPCGEGAGYAGGITSAAMDGLKVAEFISKTWRSFDRENRD